MGRLSHLRSRLERLEIAFNPHLFMFRLNGEETVFMDWDQVSQGCRDAVSGVNSRAAFVILNCIATDNDVVQRNVELVKAVLSPVDTDDEQALADYRASQQRARAKCG